MGRNFRNFSKYKTMKYFIEYFKWRNKIHYNDIKLKYNAIRENNYIRIGEAHRMINLLRPHLNDNSPLKDTIRGEQADTIRDVNKTDTRTN